MWEKEVDKIVHALLQPNRVYRKIAWEVIQTHGNIAFQELQKEAIERLTKKRTQKVRRKLSKRDTRITYV